MTWKHGVRTGTRVSYYSLCDDTEDYVAKVSQVSTYGPSHKNLNLSESRLAAGSAKKN